jgi:hypothetical protein
MTIIYNEDEPQGEFKGYMVRVDPTKAYLKHYENYLYLQFIAMNTADRVERYQANKELKICERKLEHWKKNPSFNQAYATEKSAELKKLWMPRKMK